MARGLFKRGGVWWLRYSDGFGKIIRVSGVTWDKAIYQTSV